MRKPRYESIKHLPKVTALVCDGVRIRTPEPILNVTTLYCLPLGDIQ